LISKETKLIVINFPHNPTGSVIADDELIQIADLAEGYGVILFSDEMYRLLEYGARPRAAGDVYENAVSLFGLSKSFSLPGLRIGWLATKNGTLLQQFSEYKDYTTICNSAPSEILALIALKNKNRIIDRNLRIIRENLGLLDFFFLHHRDLFTWNRPQAGPIAFPSLLGDLQVDRFCSDLREKSGVLLLPAVKFDYDGNHFRIGFGRKNMPEALEKLKEFVAESF
jgi:aspartate/methionine/tyrosine aminotransferase